MFTDRIQGGKKLAQKVARELEIAEPGKKHSRFVVLSIPRGGVVVGQQIAKKLGCLHDVIVTKKLRAPLEAELAIGAVGETRGSLYLDRRLAADVRADKTYLEAEIKNRQQEIGRREKVYRQNCPEIKLAGKTVILVDDGAATGATMVAACREVWNRQPHRVVVALPVCAAGTLPNLEKEVDMALVLEKPALFYAVGQFYRSFPQVSDKEVIKRLRDDS